MAALLSAVLLLGGVLPGLQGLCAERASAVSPGSVVHADAAAMSHAHDSSHECEGDCVGIACCASVPSFTDCASVPSFTETPDLRLPDRGAAADRARLRTVEDVSVPAPERDESEWVRDIEPGLLSSVRLHVWTATFLS